MWYIKVLSNLLIAVALICTIQDVHTLDTNAIKKEWTDLANSAVISDLAIISEKCGQLINNFNEGLNKSKTSADTKLSEPNNTTEDIVNLAAETKKQVTNTSNDLVSVRKLIQQVALRFRDTFKSVKSLTDLQCESVSKELETIRKTEVNKQKPLVNRVIKSFANRYDVNKLADRLLQISLDGKKLNDNYDKKKKQAMKELSSLYITLDNYAQSINDDAIDTLKTLYEGLHAVKSVRKNVKNFRENALNYVKEGNDLQSLKDAVELTKALKLTFKDEWNLDSGELTYSEELKQASMSNNKQDISNDNNPKNIIQADSEQKQQEPIVENDKQDIIQPDIKEKQSVTTDTSMNNNNVGYSIKEMPLNPKTQNKDRSSTPVNLENNESKNPNITKKTRGKKIIKPWDELINYDNPQISQESKKCKDLLQNTIPELENIKASTKNIIQSTKSDNDIKKTENDAVKQFYDKMVDTNIGLTNNLITAADGDFANVTPIDKSYEAKFNDDPNIKRIKYLLGKNYDPNRYILKVIKDASQNPGKGGMKKTSYYKMLSVTHNLKNEIKEIDDTALYAMNKILDGKQAVTDMSKPGNKEKFAKACYIYNILSQKETENERIDKTGTKEKVKEIINGNNTNEPLKPDVNLDYIDKLEPSTVKDEERPQVNNNSNESSTSNELTTNDRPIQTKTDEKTNDINETITPNEKSSKGTQNNNKQNNDEPENLRIVEQKQEQMENNNTINTKIPKQTSNTDSPIKSDEERFSLNNPRNQNAGDKSIPPQSFTIDARSPNTDGQNNVSREHQITEETEKKLDDETEKNKPSITKPSLNSDEASVTPHNGKNQIADDISKPAQSITIDDRPRHSDDPNYVSGEYELIEETEEELDDEPETNKTSKTTNPNKNLEKVDVIPNDGSSQNVGDKTKGPKKVTGYKRHRKPEDPNDVSEKYNPTDETDKGLKEDLEHKQSEIENPNVNINKSSVIPHDNTKKIAEDKSKPAKSVTIDDRPRHSDDPNYVSGEYELIEETEEEPDDETEKNKQSITKPSLNLDKAHVATRDGTKKIDEDKSKPAQSVTIDDRPRHSDDPNYVSGEYEFIEETEEEPDDETETNKTSETTNLNQNSENGDDIPNDSSNQNVEDKTKGPKKVKGRKRHRKPENPNNVSEKFNPTEETDKGLKEDLENKQSEIENPNVNINKSSVIPHDSTKKIAEDKSKPAQSVTIDDRPRHSDDPNYVSGEYEFIEETEEEPDDETETNKTSKTTKPNQNSEKGDVIPNDSSSQNVGDETKGPKKVTGYKRHRKPEDPNDVSEKFNPTEETDKGLKEDLENKQSEIENPNVNINKSSVIPHDSTKKIAEDKSKPAQSVTIDDRPRHSDDPNYVSGEYELIEETEEEPDDETETNKTSETTNLNQNSENGDDIPNDSSNQNVEDKTKGPKKVKGRKRHRKPENPNNVSEKFNPTEETDKGLKEDLENKQSEIENPNVNINKISVDPKKDIDNNLNSEKETIDQKVNKDTDFIKDEFNIKPEQKGETDEDKNNKSVIKKRKKKSNLTGDEYDVAYEEESYEEDTSELESDEKKSKNTNRKQEHATVQEEPNVMNKSQNQNLNPHNKQNINPSDSTPEKDDSENLDSVEQKELNGVDHDEIQAKVDSYEESSESIERKQMEEPETYQPSTSENQNHNNQIPKESNSNNNTLESNENIDSIEEEEPIQVKNDQIIPKVESYESNSSSVDNDELEEPGVDESILQHDSSKQTDMDNDINDNVNDPDEQSDNYNPITSPKQKRYRKVRRPRVAGKNSDDTNTDEKDVPDHITVNNEIDPDDLKKNGGNSYGDVQTNSSKQSDIDDDIKDQNSSVNGSDEQNDNYNPLYRPRRKHSRKVRRPRVQEENDDLTNIDKNKIPEHDSTIDKDVPDNSRMDTEISDDRKTNENIETPVSHDYDSNDVHPDNSKQSDLDDDKEDRNSPKNGPVEQNDSYNPLYSPRQKRYRKVRRPRVAGENGDDNNTDENQVPEHESIIDEVVQDNSNIDGENADDEQNIENIDTPVSHENENNNIQPDTSKQSDLDDDTEDRNSSENAPVEQNDSYNPLYSPRQKRYRKVRRPRVAKENGDDNNTDENQVPEHENIIDEVVPDKSNIDGGNADDEQNIENIDPPVSHENKNNNVQPDTTKQSDLDDDTENRNSSENAPVEQNDSYNPLYSPRQKRYRKVRRPRVAKENGDDNNTDENQVPEHESIIDEVVPDNSNIDGGNADDEQNIENIDPPVSHENENNNVQPDTSKQSDLDDDTENRNSSENAPVEQNDSYNPLYSPRQKRYRKVRTPRVAKENGDDNNTDENQVPEHESIIDEVVPDNSNIDGGNADDEQNIENIDPPVSHENENNNVQPDTSKQSDLDDDTEDRNSSENGPVEQNDSYNPLYSPRQKRYRKVRRPRVAKENGDDNNTDENQVPEHESIIDEVVPDNSNIDGGNADNEQNIENIDPPVSHENENNNVQPDTSKQSDLDDDTEDRNSSENGPVEQNDSYNPLYSPRQKRYRKVRRPRVAKENGDDNNTDENQVPEHESIIDEVVPDNSNIDGGNADDEQNIENIDPPVSHENENNNVQPDTSKQSDLDDDTEDRNSSENGPVEQNDSYNPLYSPRQKRYRKVRRPRVAKENGDDNNTDENQVPEHESIIDEVVPDNSNIDGGNADDEQNIENIDPPVSHENENNNVQPDTSKQSDLDDDTEDRNSSENGPVEQNDSYNPLYSPRQKRYRKVRRPRVAKENGDDNNTDENQVPEHESIIDEVVPENSNIDGGNADDEQNIENIDPPVSHENENNNVQPDTSKQSDLDDDTEDRNSSENGPVEQNDSYNPLYSPRQKRYRKVRRPRVAKENGDDNNTDENQVPEHESIIDKVVPDNSNIDGGNADDEQVIENIYSPRSHEIDNNDLQPSNLEQTNINDNIIQNDNSVNNPNEQSDNLNPIDSPRPKRYRKVRRPRIAKENGDDTNTNENEVPEHDNIIDDDVPDNSNINGGNSNYEQTIENIESPGSHEYEDNNIQPNNLENTDTDDDINEIDNSVNDPNEESDYLKPIDSPRKKRYRKVRRPRVAGENSDDNNTHEKDEPEHDSIIDENVPDNSYIDGGISDDTKTIDKFDSPGSDEFDNHDLQPNNLEQTYIDDDINDNDNSDNNPNEESDTYNSIISPKPKRYRKVRRPRVAGENSDDTYTHENEEPEHDSIIDEDVPDNSYIDGGNSDDGKNIDSFDSPGSDEFDNHDLQPNNSEQTYMDDDINENDNSENDPNEESDYLNPIDSPRQKRYRKVRRPRVAGENSDDTNTHENEEPEHDSIIDEDVPDNSYIDGGNSDDAKTIENVESPGSHEYDNNDIQPNNSEQTYMDDDINDNNNSVNDPNEESDYLNPIDSPRKKRYRKVRRPRVAGENDIDTYSDENEVPEHNNVIDEDVQDNSNIDGGNSDDAKTIENVESPGSHEYDNNDIQPNNSEQTYMDDDINDNDNSVNDPNEESDYLNPIDSPRKKRYRKVRRPRVAGENDIDTYTDENEVPEHNNVIDEDVQDNSNIDGGNSDDEQTIENIESPGSHEYDNNDIPPNNSEQTYIDDDINDNDNSVNDPNEESDYLKPIDSPRKKRYRKVRRPRVAGENDIDTYTDENEVPEHNNVIDEDVQDNSNIDGGNSDDEQTIENIESPGSHEYDNNDIQPNNSEQTYMDDDINDNDNSENDPNEESDYLNPIDSPRKKRYRKVRRPRVAGENSDDTNTHENEEPEHDSIIDEDVPDNSYIDGGNSDDAKTIENVESPGSHEYDNNDIQPNNSEQTYMDDDINDNDNSDNNPNEESDTYNSIISPKPKRYRKVRRPRVAGENSDDTYTHENEEPEHDSIIDEDVPDNSYIDGGNSDDGKNIDSFDSPGSDEFDNHDLQPNNSEQTYMDDDINDNDNSVNDPNEESDYLNPIDSPRKKRYRKVRRPRVAGENDIDTYTDKNEVPEHNNVIDEDVQDNSNIDGGNSDDEQTIENIESPGSHEYDNNDIQPNNSEQTYMDDDIIENNNSVNNPNEPSDNYNSIISPRPKRYRKVRRPRVVSDNDKDTNTDENEVPEHASMIGEDDPVNYNMDRGNSNEGQTIEDTDSPGSYEYDNNDVRPNNSEQTYTDDDINENEDSVNYANEQSDNLNPIDSPIQKRFRKFRRPRVAGENGDDGSRDTRYSVTDPQPVSSNPIEISDNNRSVNVSNDQSDNRPNGKRYRKVRRPKVDNANVVKPIVNKSEYVKPEHHDISHFEDEDGINKFRRNSDEGDNKNESEVPETIHHVKEQPKHSKLSENDGEPHENEKYVNGATGHDNINNSTPRRGKRYKRVRRPRVIGENASKPGNNNNGNIIDGIPKNHDADYDNVPNKDDGTNNNIDNVIDSNNNIVLDQNNILGDSNKKNNGDNELANNSTEPIEGGNNKKLRPKTKKRIKHIRSYMVNKKTNEKIPINDKTYATVNGVREIVDNTQKLIDNDNLLDESNPDSPEANKTDDEDAFSLFLFNEYNADQCKRDAYDKFKKVSSQDSKQIAYGSILDTSELRSSILTVINDAIRNVKASKTKQGVNQSMMKVSDTLKTGLKKTISSFLYKMVPFGRDYLKTANTLTDLYLKGPQSTHKMLSNIMYSEPTIPDSAAKDILKLISPEFNVDDMVDNIFKNRYKHYKNLKKFKSTTQRKLIDLSKNMDTAISNIDCSMLSAMSTVGLGMDTMKSLKSGRMIMSDKHPRAQALKDAIEIIKLSQNSNFDANYSPNPTSPLVSSPDNYLKSTENDDYDDPDRVAEKNEEFLKNVPQLDNDVPIPKKVLNKRQSLGIIVVHPDNHIEYREVTDTSELNKFVGDQTKKYKLQPKSNYPKFLKVNSNKVIDTMVDDIKIKAQENGMTKKEVVDELITSLKNNN